MSGINKITAERNQRTLMELVNQPGNDVCADCKSRNPRWASHNLGIFICVHCASIHRKMGTHISKVKSLTMDSWSKEQVEVMKANGNIKSNAHYNPDETRNPPPTNMIDSERDSELEKYIRYKYEYKKFVSRSAQVAALLGPSKSASSRLTTTAPTRSATMPAINSPSTPSSSQLAPTPSLPTTSSSTSITNNTQSSIRSPSQPVAPPAPPPAQIQAQAQVQQRPATQPPQQQHPSNPLWNDLAQLQAPAANSSLPLQYASPATTQPISIPTLPTNTGLGAPNHFSGLSVSPNNPFPSQLAQQGTGMFPGGVQRSMSLNLPPTNLTGMGGSPAPSMFQPQPTMGGLSTQSTLLPQHQNTTPSPSPYGSQTLPPANLGIQQPFAQSTFAQQMLPQSQMQMQGSPMMQAQPQLQPQGSPMISYQQMQSSPMIPTQQLQMQQQPSMYQQQAFGQPQPQMQMGGPFGGMGMQSQPQMGAYGGSPQPPFMGSPSPAPFGQQPQQQMYQQQSAFGGTGWQQPGYPGQQQWGGM